MKLQDFDFILPKELIAQYPANPRTEAKLLHIAKEQKKDLSFAQIISLLNKDDLLIFNDTKVIPAKLIGYKNNGGKISCNLIEEVKTSHYQNNIHIWKSLIKGKIKIDDIITFNENLKAKIVKKDNDFVIMEFIGDFHQVIEEIGLAPLPPYIKRNNLDKRTYDKNNYQTVYAKNYGAVAAPTAGLHFTKELMQQIKEAGIEICYLTLHVGAGTFTPIRSENITDHKMHKEYYSISDETSYKINKALKEKKRIISVGTTTLRALESNINDNIAKYHKAQISSCSNQKTDIFIYPGYKFKVVNSLITNFHLPKSSLFILICSFMGRENAKNVYDYAITKKYRFYSYGDALFIER